MAAKNGPSGKESLATIAVAIGRHLDRPDRPILRALETLTAEMRGVRNDLRSLNKTTATNFERLREDLRARSIPARTPRFHRSAATGELSMMSS